MRKALPKLREALEEEGHKVEDIRYYTFSKLTAIGFKVTNPKNDNYVTVEPRGFSEWFVNGYSEFWRLDNIRHMHYARKRDGWMPGLCRPYSKLKEEILKHLK